MTPKKTNNTVNYPHRLMNKASIYLTEQKETTPNKFQSVTHLQNDLILTVTSKTKINPSDGKVFDYILSLLRYQKGSIQNIPITVNLTSMIKAFGYKNRTETRNKIVKHIENMVGVEVLLQWYDDQEASFEMIESFESVDNSIYQVNISQSFLDDMDSNVAKRRAINISQTFKIQSGYTLELAKVLQMKGGGINNEGLPLCKTVISHLELCEFLHLDSASKSSLSQIRKSLNQLSLHNYPHYKYSAKTKKWSIIRQENT
jgi:hypothetical protein